MQRVVHKIISVVLVSMVILLCFVFTTSFLFAQGEASALPGDGTSVEDDGTTVIPEKEASPTASAVSDGGIDFKSYEPIVNIPGVSSDGTNRTLPDLLNALFRILIGVGAMLAVIRIAISGVKYMASETSISSKEEAKQDITNSVFGLLVLLAIFLLLTVINPQLTNLNFLTGASLPPITTTHGDALRTYDEASDASGLSAKEIGELEEGCDGTLVLGGVDRRTFRCEPSTSEGEEFVPECGEGEIPVRRGSGIIFCERGSSSTELECIECGESLPAALSKEGTPPEELTEFDTLCREAGGTLSDDGAFRLCSYDE